MRRGNEFITRLEQRHHRDKLCGLPAGSCQCPSAPFEGCDTLLKDRSSGSADARINVAGLLYLKERSRILRAVENIACRLVNRHSARTLVRIRYMPGMEHARFKTEFSFLRHGHEFSVKERSVRSKTNSYLMVTATLKL